MAVQLRRVRWPAIGLVAVVVVGGGTTYAIASGDSTPTYRTVAATTGDVEQTLTSSGTVDAAQRADLGFGTAGTVKRFKVAVGDTVRTGQVLAVLDTTSLDAAVTDARAVVARAVAQLASDRTAQTASVSQAAGNGSGSAKPRASDGSGGSGGSGSNGSGGSGGSGGAATAAVLQQLAALQVAVLEAQSAASAAIADARSALAVQTTACADAYATPAAGDEGTGASDAGAPCSTALAQVQADQQEVSDKQDALAEALTDLSAALTKTLSGLSHPAAATRATATSARAVSASSAQTPSVGGDGSSSGGTTVTAARLASDQAQIDSARADLISAQQDRAAAVLRSTRSGTVAALDAAAGDSVSAGDTVATVIGGRAVTVTGSVPETEVAQVRVGQKVRVTTPGVTRTAAGTVTAIGLVADSTSGTTTYPVTVTVEDPAIALPTGSSAMLQIVLSTVKDVVVVPTSAVVRRGTGAVVRTWNGTTLATTPVTLGAVGNRSVQVASGLRAGTQVVLAAVDDPIKGASSTVNDRTGPGGNFQFRGAPGGAGGARPTTVTKN
ncbi:MAG: HlyD family efflux transporter periplasmic adaptor subunit [Marmoricola sp.]